MPYIDEYSERELTVNDIELIQGRGCVYVVCDCYRSDSFKPANFKGSGKALCYIANRFETKEDIVKNMKLNKEWAKMNNKKVWLSNKMSDEEYKEFMSNIRNRPRFR